ncbi:MAG TPA: hypothetical protein VG125_22775 [Pirellulales bacterium]|jgi:hypothetical protein|nr:hypothetical protein [Pirellulales bacterium]
MSRLLLWVMVWSSVSAALAADPASSRRPTQVRFAAASRQPPIAGTDRATEDGDTEDGANEDSAFSGVLQPIDEYLKAAPPADPPPAQWGSLEQPIRGQLELPTYNYVLAGPPRRVIQQERLQPYQRPVEDPDRLSFDDDLLNMPIDLYRPDGIAPAGVTGDHLLKSGHALFSYRYSTVGYQGSQTGTHVDNLAGVLNQFSYAPRWMYKQQHLFLFEYALSDDLTAMVQFPIEQNSISYALRDGSRFNDSYTQLGDISLWALYSLKRWQNQQLHANLGISIPTNLLQSHDHFSTPGSVLLSYPLRPGSGSYDLMPGLTYRGQTERWTWGVQSIATIRTGRNRYQYELGNQIDINAWAWRRLTQRFALSGRLHGMGWGNIRGADPNLTANLVETNAANLQGGTRVDLLFGGNYYWPWLRIPGNYFSLESGFPIYQNLHGPQPRATWLLFGAWNMMW